MCSRVCSNRRERGIAAADDNNNNATRVMVVAAAQVLCMYSTYMLYYGEE